MTRRGNESDRAAQAHRRRRQGTGVDHPTAAELGYVPAGDYRATVAGEAGWLARVAEGGPAAIGETFEDGFLGSGFGYEAEDRYLARRAG